MRAAPTHLSEQASQLLFGEEVFVKEIQYDWAQVKNIADGYRGWVPRALLAESDEEFSLHVLSNSIWQLNNGQQKHVPKGARVPADSFVFAGSDWRLISGEVGPSLPTVRVEIVKTASSLLGLPYLWGGRSPYGVDCSGLVQWAAGLHGIELPRDAWQQALMADPIPFDDQQVGDLAFFQNTYGRVTHVGFVLPAQQILHSAGSSGVRVDVLTTEGIHQKDAEKITHVLHSIVNIYD
jgi:gamma-D-glutamyl-L-lysine dipeptidyl-peptidase